MASKDIIDREAEASEAQRDAPVPAGIRPTRPGRAVVLSVRLNPEEFEALSEHAREHGVPVSTMARSLVVRALREDQIGDIGATTPAAIAATVYGMLPEIARRVSETISAEAKPPEIG